MFSSNTSQVSSGGYEIQRSLRFNEPDSAYLNRTPASAGNRRTYTFSAWIKRSKTGTDGDTVISSMPSGAQFRVFFETANTLRLFSFDGSFQFQLITTQVFRDFSAWGHLVVAIDTTQATAANRVRVYWNAAEITSFSTTTYPSQNADLQFNQSGQPHSIGATISSPVTSFFNGYMTEMNFIDGQALTPSSFGAFDAQTGVWGPTRYAGSYGTNGFYLNFSDNSNTTAATLGRDYSGNSNNWTPNNFSVSAGAGNDSLVDVPTNWGVDTGVGGTVRGNYATLNPLQISTTFAAISNGNLQYVDTTAGGSYRAAYSTVFASSGKYYFEAISSSVSGTPFPAIGLASPPPKNDTYIYETIANYQGYCYFANGEKGTNDTASAFGASYTTGDTISVAVDIDAGKVWFAKNGTWQASGDPAAGTNPAFNIVTGRAYGFAVANDSSASSIQIDANFGQRPFAYTAPSGFRALNTQNLPTPTIGATTATQAGKFFNPVLYTGNGFPTSGTQSISVGFQPDWVWIKARGNVGTHTLTDVVRGVNSQLFTNSTAAQESNADSVTAFNSSGFSLGANTTGLADTNVNNSSYVAWNWRANGAGVTNTAGSITSTVSANTTSGFSVVTWTANGGAATIGHGLGVAPRMIIVKARNNAQNWFVYHQSIGATAFLVLNGANAATTNDIWQNIAPTSSVFSTAALTFPNTWTYVAYCFAEVPGYSRFGSWTGNGSADGPFVFFGFRPAYVLLKNTTTAGNSWHILDVARGTINVQGPELRANESVAESVFTVGDFVSNGFKLRDTNQAWNKSGDLYIFMAFASNPFKFSLAR